MLISILASSFFIKSIAFNAGKTFSLLNVVVKTVWVFLHAEITLIESKSLLASNTSSVSISVAVCYFTSFVCSQLERVTTLLAAIISSNFTSINKTLTIAKSKRSFAWTADSFLVINATWNSFNTFFLLVIIVIIAHTFDTHSKLINLIAELIFGNT